MAEPPRRRGWRGKQSSSAATSPRDELTNEQATGGSASPPTYSPSSPFRRSDSSQSISSLLLTRSMTPLAPKRPSANPGSPTVLTKELDSQNALERTTSNNAAKSQDGARKFGGMSLSSVMGGLSSLSLGRTSEERERGRSEKTKESVGFRSSSLSVPQDDERSSSRSRARSQSPFQLRRLRRDRDTSPTVEALSQSDVESDAESVVIRPRNAFNIAGNDDDEYGDTSDEEGSEESWTDEEELDSVTERNTERNAIIPAVFGDQPVVDEPDPLGEGPNVVIAPEPYFPSTLNGGNRAVRRRKSSRPHDTLQLVTSRPVFQRDRCTITLTHGDPARSLEETGRKPKRYVLASDLSDESRYAMEWSIGTVLRDGDEILIITVIENESKVDPVIPNPTDRTSKLRSQQERQALAYILVRQATSLLQRTRLHVTISCQAWHAKNARHMVLDIVDYVEPTMLIVGSRGLGHLKGILLGSTSHYLVQRCSVPVMVARRRLKRPPRRSAHLAPHRARVSLAQAAGVDRVATKVDQDVEVMRSQMEQEEKEEERRADGVPHEVDEDVDTEVEGDNPLGTKIAG